MSRTEFIPNLTKALVETLEERFPPRCKTPGETEEHHQRYAGQVVLVAHLRAQLDQQGETLGYDLDSLA